MAAESPPEGALHLDEDALTERFDQLVNDGVIFYDSDPKVIPYEDGGFKFEFRITKALENKPDVPSAPLGSVATGRPAPITIPGSDISVSGFEIADVAPAHLLTYNMFNGFRPHFLLLTRDGHRRQFEPLDAGDVRALHAVVSALRGEFMVLFNCGVDSGCSRMHKHMQLVPHAGTTFDVWRDIIDRGAELPFRSFIRRFHAGLPDPDRLLAIYLDLLDQANKALGQSVSKDNVSPAHNVIFDRKGIMVIPRRAAGIGQSGANAAGMLGVMWMSTEEKARRWMEIGPLNILKAAGVPKAPEDAF